MQFWLRYAPSTAQATPLSSPASIGAALAHIWPGNNAAPLAYSVSPWAEASTAPDDHRMQSRKPHHYVSFLRIITHHARLAPQGISTYHYILSDAPVTLRSHCARPRRTTAARYRRTERLLQPGRAGSPGCGGANWPDAVIIHIINLTPRPRRLHAANIIATNVCPSRTSVSA